MREYDVSIHAPARGATMLFALSGNVVMFQSTRPRGARRGVFNCFLCNICFNPRAREGRDSSV